LFTLATVFFAPAVACRGLAMTLAVYLGVACVAAYSHFRIMR
jgi:hypothetical protein